MECRQGCGVCLRDWCRRERHEDLSCRVSPDCLSFGWFVRSPSFGWFVRKDFRRQSSPNVMQGGMRSMKPTFRENNRFVSKCSVVLTSDNEDVLIRLLLNHGLPGDFNSLEQWAFAASCDVLLAFESFLSEMATHSLAHP
jgi:hypothetical protein